MSGIYLFNATTVGDPASATAFIVTENGFVGVNTDTPNTNLTVNGSISARTNMFVRSALSVFGNSTLGDSKFDTNILRGEVYIADSSPTSLVFGDGNVPANYDTNLYRGEANLLRTDDSFHCNSLSSMNALTGADIVLTNAFVTTLPSATASGEFLILNLNGEYKAIRLWDTPAIGSFPVATLP